MLQPLSADDAARFRDVFHAANYSDTRLAETFGTSIPPPSHHPQFAAISEQASAATPLCCLARLFFLGSPVADDEAKAVLPGWLIDTSLDCGLLQRNGASLQPCALLTPCGQWLLAADLHDTNSQNDQAYVLTVSQPAFHLSAFAVRRPARATLDLCGGFAMHGIMAGCFSESVVSSDLNPRAKMFAEFNAALNDCTNLEAVTGDLFEPVAGRKFDLILTNPPFLISPMDVATYRENPLELDGFLKKMLTQAPEHLEEGGFFQAICEWVEIRGQDWRDRLSQWLQNNGCDAWVLQANRQLPASYADGCLRQSTPDPNEFAAELENWNQYFEDRNVEAIYGGLIFLRRRQGDNWCDFTQLSSAVTEPIGDVILQGFASRDLLHHADGEQALLGSRLHVSPGVKQEEVTHWENNAWQTDSISLRIESGLPVSIGIDAPVRELISRFDGHRTVEEVLKDFAKHLSMPLDTARPQALPMVDHLLRNGFLVLPSG